MTENIWRHLVDIFTPTLAKIVTGVLALVLVAPPFLYQLVLIAVVLDTFSGILAAQTRGTFNSRTLRVKTLSKVISYTATIVGMALLHHAAREVGLSSELTLPAVKFVLASIVLTEVISVWENIRAATNRTPIGHEHLQEVIDFLKAQHLKETHDTTKHDSSKH